MPRPGPRPYECVRRAWHSERHQPMRGSIIQQIFRFVNDTHSPITKKNKEWQEKLPIVVLKAEEIMYSKANSEAEYMDSDTLWDRLNDAINTIIRRDESNETGELLPPCVEAALNLGCIPVRASRSQRHSNPRSYLTPSMQEPVSAPPRVAERTNDKQCPQLSPFWSLNQLNFARDSTVVNSLLPVSEPSCHLAETSNVAASCSYHLLYENVPRGCSRLMTKETNKQLNLGLVYPLYYGNSYHTDQRHLVSQVPEENFNSVIVGTPISTSVAESSEMNTFQSFLACPDAGTAVMRVSQAELRSAHENPPGLQCDLSLRLGPLTNSCMSMERSLVQETEDVGLSNPRDKTKFSDFSFKRNVDQCFSTGRNNNNSFELHPFKWFSMGNDQNLDPAIRKRKAPSDFPSN